MPPSDPPAHSLVPQLIDDISTLWHVWSQGEAAEIEGKIAAYLVANRRIIEDLLHLVYERHTTADRQQLLSEDPALDKLAIPYAFYETASVTIRDLPEEIQEGSAELCEEDFTMLLRALEFARGFDAGSVEGTLSHSPAATYLANKGPAGG
jgi:hypothetical protein